MVSTATPSHVDLARVVDVNIYGLPGQEDDFHAAWKALQDSAKDMVWTPQNEGHWIALRGAALAEVQSDHERFSSRIIIIPKSVGENHGLIPTTMDPPEHRPYRKLLNDGMTLGRVRELHASIRAMAAELIEGFHRKGRCDFTSEYARIFPIRIFMALVGIPMRDAEQIRLWAECMTRPNPPLSFEEAKQAFYRYLEPLIAERRAAPGGDLISHLVASKMSDGRTVGHDEALALCTQVLIAGVDTVVNFLGFVMHYLARHPEACEGLAGQPSNQIMAATHELFRRFGLVIIARTVRNDMDYHGVFLKAGELVCIPTQVHGLDERINADPMRVNFARTGGRHSAFGSGPHMCPGQELARAEVAITIEEWLRRIPRFRVAADADTRCSGGIVAQVNRLVLEWDV
ncbi:MAG: cytochrome P450 [Sphingobium sp.]